MKFLKENILKLLTIVLMATACTDFVEPNIPYATFDTGAYLRTITRTSTTFNFFALPTSRFDIVVEAVDAEDGKTLQTVEVRVRRRRLVPGVGNVYVPAAGAGGAVNDVLVKTLNASDFQPNPDSRFLRANIVVTAPEAIAALGLTQADINGGDAFEIRLKLTDKFGRVFNDVNASGDVKGGAFFSSPFLYSVGVVCPSDLAGTYAFTSSQMVSAFGACAGTITGSVTLTAIANTTNYTVSDATFGFWGCYGDTWGSGNVRLQDACGVLSFAGADKYGDGYTFTFISNDGTDLTFRWRNASNETGVVTLRANAGKPWPNTLR